LIDALSATPSQYSEHNEVSAKSWILCHLSALSIYSAHVTMVNECCIKYYIVEVSLLAFFPLSKAETFINGF